MGDGDKKLYFYLERHEGTIARMYRYFAKAFPEHEDFWLEIARQETKHARWIMSLSNRPDEETVATSGLHFNPHHVQESIAKIEAATRRCLEGKLDLREALEIALEFEDGIIESQFFKIFRFKGDKGAEILRLLEMETDSHRQRITDLLSKVRKTG